MSKDKIQEEFEQWAISVKGNNILAESIRRCDTADHGVVSLFDMMEFYAQGRREQLGRRLREKTTETSSGSRNIPLCCLPRFLPSGSCLSVKDSIAHRNSALESQSD